MGLLIAVVLPIFFNGLPAWALLILFVLYLFAVAIGAGVKSGSARAALLAPGALLVQYVGYGLGFLKSAFLLTFSKKKPEVLMPGLFFKP